MHGPTSNSYVSKGRNQAMKGSDLRKGMVIRYDGQVYKVLESIHRTPGNLRAFVQAKLRNVITGLSTEQRFRSEDILEKVSLDTKTMQFLYHDAAGYHFMDTDTYEQFALPDEVLGDTMSYVVPDSTVTMDWFEGKPIGV